MLTFVASANTWSKRVTPRTSSLASTTNVNITPQNPPSNPVSATWSTIHRKTSCLFAIKKEQDQPRPPRNMHTSHRLPINVPPTTIYNGQRLDIIGQKKMQYLSKQNSLRQKLFGQNHAIWYQTKVELYKYTRVNKNRAWWCGPLLDPSKVKTTGLRSFWKPKEIICYKASIYQIHVALL